MEFIKTYKVFFLLLSVSLLIPVLGLFIKCVYITIGGILFSTAITIYRTYQSYKGNKELKTQISNLEKALNIKKDTNGEIESITIDGGTF